MGKNREEKEGFFFKIALLMNFSWAQTKPLLFYKIGKEQMKPCKLKMSQISLAQKGQCRVTLFYFPYKLGNLGKLDL